MKLTRLPTRTTMKTVQYFNLELIVPEHIKYISIDPGGEIVLWLNVYKPYILQYRWDEEDWCGEVYEMDMGTVDLEGMDWRETLVEYEVKEEDELF